MSTRTQHRGFTLIELLVAVALISTVLSITYGSYVVTTKSARACKSRIALSEQGRTALEQIARHVRCSFAGSDSGRTEDSQARSDQPEAVPETTISYFDGNAHAPNGEILSFVSTNGLREEEGTKDGLFQVVYRFDRRRRELALSLARFVGTAERTGKRDWRVIADQVKSVDLAFFDGEKWLDRWEFEDKKVLPRAVRIELGGENESLQRYDYSTVAYVSCRDYQSEERTQTLVSVEK
jgi:type II secretion system protein J